VEFVYTEKSLRRRNDEALARCVVEEFDDDVATRTFAEATRHPDRFRGLRELWGEPTQEWFSRYMPELLGSGG
jgi:hypothetical protein